MYGSNYAKQLQVLPDEINDYKDVVKRVQEVDKGKMQEIKISLKEILSELRYEGYDEKKIASLIHEIYQDLEG